MISNIQQISPNRFSGGCRANLSAGCRAHGDDKTYVKDILWYPDKNTIVVKKNNKQDLIIDLSNIIGN